MTHRILDVVATTGCKATVETARPLTDVEERLAQALAALLVAAFKDTPAPPTDPART